MSFTGVDRVHVTTQGSVPADIPQFARAKVESLLRLASEPVPFAHVTLTTTADPAVELPAIARANVDLDGRIIRVQAAGETVHEAVGRMSRRLRVRLERAARNWEARRGAMPARAPGEWRHQSIAAGHPRYFPRPADERQVIRRRSYATRRETPAEARAELDLLDYDFHLFTDRRNGQDSVLYRTGDGYGLARARRASAYEPLPVLVRLAEQPAPRLMVGDAIARLEVLGQEFLFFVDVGTGRGSLVYHRYDGHYGLIVPADADGGYKRSASG